MTLGCKVSVVIPVKNAGPDFEVLLGRLRAQRGVRELEIVVVDSGSTDGSVTTARRHGCKVARIAPERFSHSRARNLGVARATGDYVLMMVQDALPVGDLWVRRLVDALRARARRGVAAVTCREFPRSDSDLFYNFLMEQHYGYLAWPGGDRETRYESDETMSLVRNGALNDIACLLPRELARRYRYRGYYGEDLDLGVRLIRDGRRLALLSSVKVIHSHDRPPFAHLKRFFVSSLALHERFEEIEAGLRDDPRGALAAVHLVFRIVDRVAREAARLPADVDSAELARLVSRAFPAAAAEVRPHGWSPLPWTALKDEELAAFLDGVFPGPADEDCFKRLYREILNNSMSLCEFIERVYPVLDARGVEAAAGALVKTAAVRVGDYLGALCHGWAGDARHRELMDRLRRTLGRGV